jgi:hypothetical protein
MLREGWQVMEDAISQGTFGRDHRAEIASK